WMRFSAPPSPRDWFSVPNVGRTAPSDAGDATGVCALAVLARKTAPAVLTPSTDAPRMNERRSRSPRRKASKRFRRDWFLCMEAAPVRKGVPVCVTATPYCTAIPGQTLYAPRSVVEQGVVLHAQAPLEPGQATEHDQPDVRPDRQAQRWNLDFRPADDRCEGTDQVHQTGQLDDEHDQQDGERHQANRPAQVGMLPIQPRPPCLGRPPGRLKRDRVRNAVFPQMDVF